MLFLGGVRDAVIKDQRSRRDDRRDQNAICHQELRPKIAARFMKQEGIQQDCQADL
jgi:hypothetical protein